ncbi:MAG: threonylcarbamoyl-AMP synthase [Balneolaceae bacterium]|nr:MAG: threonylcarbamoyl-AMP synthase [Balneolaceae bacterium]
MDRMNLFKMAQRIKIHETSPHRKSIFELTDELNRGAVALIPTDSQYALVCDYKNKKGIERIRQIRQLGKKDHLTVMCHNLEHVSTFAALSDHNFKLIKDLIPGTFTFILPATREVPRLLTHPRKRTVGIRVPDYPICLDLIRELGRPLVVTSAKLPGVEHGEPSGNDRELYLSRFENIADIIVDHQGDLRGGQTSIIDLTGEMPLIEREGLGMETLRAAFVFQSPH